MDTGSPDSPTEKDAVENETVTEERKKPWSKPVVRRIGQTVYTGTGSQTRSSPGTEDFTYTVLS